MWCDSSSRGCFLKDENDSLLHEAFCGSSGGTCSVVVAAMMATLARPMRSTLHTTWTGNNMEGREGFLAGLDAV